MYSISDAATECEKIYEYKTLLYDMMKYIYIKN